ncbi:HD-GYP domain-containing protein [Paenibacillus campi]|uniref:HD-GYP domain-containing protein n=1 Tax=Paenibacillus campi TaxID=3106031 RepID=UPI002AFDE2C3|nr:HD-GYP domain-containing protein [Paenibacillus sp. SGZ-1009]
MNEYQKFLREMVANYIIGSVLAVAVVGGLMIMTTISATMLQNLVLIGIMFVSFLIMLLLEGMTFRHHVAPIRQALLTDKPTIQQLEQAYIQLHRFPKLAIYRIMLPHFVGLTVPAIALVSLAIVQQWIALPWYYIGIGIAGAIMVASMHAFIEFFLTSMTIRPLLRVVKQKLYNLHGRDTVGLERVYLTVRKKYQLSIFLIGVFPVALFSLAAQIRLQEMTGINALEYWKWAGLVIVVSIVFSLCGALLLARDVEHPINNLFEAMSRVEDGDFGVVAHDDYSDDFSRLIVGFNNMVKGLNMRDRRNQQLLDSYFATLAAALDARDPYTAGHSQRVAKYAVEIGRRAGLCEYDIDQLRKTALLHDIGKIGVKDAVLLKDGKLTDEEFDQIKKHPAMGESILRQVEPADAMRPYLPGVRSHHERFDGKGYPDGLKGNSIPLFGRIIAVADAFDAMTSDRPYRQGMPKERAIAILEEGRGTQWDPQLATLFIDDYRRKQQEQAQANNRGAP